MRHAYQRIVFALVLAAVPLAAAAQEAFTTRDVDVFAGPSSDYPPVAALPPGTPVRLAGCLSDWSWCDVFFANDRGWVYAGDLAYPYQNNRVVILDYGPRLALPVVTFSLDSYWSAHYRARPFFRERAQWVGRVHLQANRGGTPPQGRSAQVAQPQVAQPAQPQAARVQQPRQQAVRPQQPAQSQAAESKHPQEQTARAPQHAPQPQAAESKRPQEQVAKPAQHAPQPEASASQKREQRARAPEPNPSQGMTREQPSHQAQAARQPEPTRAAPEAQKQPEAKTQPERERPKEEGRAGNQQ